MMKDQYQEVESKFKEDLILYYGGNQTDIKKYKSLIEIPQKPRKPIPACLVYTIQIQIYLNWQNYQHPNMVNYHKKTNLNMRMIFITNWKLRFDKKKLKRSASGQDLYYQEIPPFKRGPRKMKEDDETTQCKPENKEIKKEDKKDNKDTKKNIKNSHDQDQGIQDKGDSKKYLDVDQKDEHNKRRKSASKKY